MKVWPLFIEEPVANRLYSTVFKGLGADATADKIGVGLLTLTGIGIAAHAAISKFKNPKDSQEGEHDAE